MLGLWRSPSLWREALIALLCALALITGIVGARAGGELAAKSSFAGALLPCQPGPAGDAPDPDCTECRMPAPLMACLPSSGSLGRQPAGARWVTPFPSPIRSPNQILLPPSRAPPHAA